MKKYQLILTLLLIISSQVVFAQVPYRVVFDMTSKDSVNQQAVVRQAGLIRETNPQSQVEVVIYGQGLDIVLNNGTTQQKALEKLIAERNVSVKVCAATMKRMGIDKSKLLAGVEVVPDGIYEIITKQQEGWGYIKVAH